MYYDRPCDHCGGRLRYVPYAISSLVTPAWLCEGCGCLWTLEMVLQAKGLMCPVHGRLTAERKEAE